MHACTCVVIGKVLDSHEIECMMTKLCNLEHLGSIENLTAQSIASMEKIMPTPHFSIPDNKGPN